MTALCRTAATEARGLWCEPVAMSDPYSGYGMYWQCPHCEEGFGHYDKQPSSARECRGRLRAALDRAHAILQEGTIDIGVAGAMDEE